MRTAPAGPEERVAVNAPPSRPATVARKQGALDMWEPGAISGFDLPQCAAALLLALVLTAGCAPTTPTMHRPDMSTINQDHHDCILEAERTIHFGSPSRWHFYTICMKARGYTP